MAKYQNFDHEEVFVQRAGLAENNVYSLKEDSFEPKGNYFLAMYDDFNEYIGRTMTNAPAHINSDDFHGYKKPFLASKFKGTILFVKGDLLDLNVRVVIQPKPTAIKIRIDGVTNQIPMFGNIIMKVGVTLPGLAKLLNEVGVLRKKGNEDQGICMSRSNFLVLIQMVVDRVFQTCSFSPKALEGAMKGESVNLFDIVFNENFGRAFVQAFNDTAGRMNMPCIRISKVSG